MGNWGPGFAVLAWDQAKSEALAADMLVLLVELSAEALLTGFGEGGSGPDEAERGAESKVEGRAEGEATVFEDGIASSVRFCSADVFHSFTSSD